MNEEIFPRGKNIFANLGFYRKRNNMNLAMKLTLTGLFIVIGYIHKTQGKFLVSEIKSLSVVLFLIRLNVIINPFTANCSILSMRFK